MTTINLRDGLEVLYYFGEQDFDPQRNQLQDHSGYGRHATANGAPTVGVNGPSSFEAANFSGPESGDAFQQTIDNDKLDFGVSAFSMAVVLKADSLGRKQPPFGKCADYRNGTGYGITQDGGDAFIFQVTDDGNGIGAAFVAESNKWYTLVGVWSGGTGGTSRIWANGDLRDKNTDTNNNITDISNISPVTVGGRSDLNTLFPGDIAMAGIWSREISVAEVQGITDLTAPLRAQL